ncbi:Uncharacterised protein [Mycobacteroides abscessus subsp. abscessus]|nr:Uncharacterised protein [Mycobacteroides abscessus subsp. abscessus]SIG35512.1 Uncharacterised protein [Mycobacteroides abscessus subsp. abscessus]SIJ19249.1 Uncharacterised protein [Mycobacteroides abscessus subsp. abscessus]SKQ94066.1 Uncharacterised protein [Mycobacteroides abscessus subsp. abscessus]SKX41523.1 Uncharacterised protein [Mycobacteroides abscessus subsp. abscessus]
MTKSAMISPLPYVIRTHPGTCVISLFLLVLVGYWEPLEDNGLRGVQFEFDGSEVEVGSLVA